MESVLTFYKLQKFYRYELTLYNMAALIYEIDNYVLIYVRLTYEKIKAEDSTSAFSDKKMC